MNNKAITVYCASSADIDEKYFSAARHLGALIARAGFAVVNGGGRQGLMAAVSDGALAAGGQAIGVIPRFMVDNGFCHPGLSRTIVTADMHERKRTMAELSAGAIALPGGVGTFEELMEILTWQKLGLYHGPVAIFNQDGYYDPLIEMLRRASALHFSATGENESRLIATSTEEAVQMILKNLKQTTGACH